MQREYVLASGNRGKLQELAGMLEPLGFSVRPQSDWQLTAAEETASTFVENALLKARHASGHTGLPAIADDSGLVVPVLQGEPGIYSSRYAGVDASDQDNMQKLLLALQARSGAERRAYFYCAMVLVNTPDDPAPLIASGRWFGHILTAACGDGGFGYDPVFGIADDHAAGRQRSAAELSTAEKSRLSHRGQALRELLRQLQERDDGFTQ